MLPILVYRSKFVKNIFLLSWLDWSPNNSAITLSRREQAVYINKDGKDGLPGATPCDNYGVTLSQAILKFISSLFLQSVFPVTPPSAVLYAVTHSRTS